MTRTTIPSHLVRREFLPHLQVQDRLDHDQVPEDHRLRHQEADRLLHRHHRAQGFPWVLRVDLPVVENRVVDAS